MATFTPIKNRKQSKGALLGTLLYILRDDKTSYDGMRVVSANSCTVHTAYLEMMTTKQRFNKTEGRQFYQFVQSFPENENITPQQSNQIGLELAMKQFPDFEVVIATHCDTDNIHNHILVNSVSYKTGKKLHQNHDDLVRHRKVNDEICEANGFSILENYQKKQKKKGMKAGEWRAAERGESWKFTLIKAIEDALLYSIDKKTFIANMEYEGYEADWSDSRKYITYTCPNGMKCRDNKLHDETYLKENLEKLLEYRSTTGFIPLTPEPDSGWLSQIYPSTNIVSDVIGLGKNIEDIGDTSPPLALYVHTDSKQKRRENLKKLAMGHKLSSEQEMKNGQSY